MHLHIGNYTTENIHLNIMNTWLTGENHEQFLLFCLGCFPHFWTPLPSLHPRAYYSYTVPQAANSNTLVVLLEMNEALQQGSDMVCRKQKNPFMLFPSWTSENNPCGESRSSTTAAAALLLHYCNTWSLIPDLINVTGLKCMSLPLEY